ncbi:helix-turn-helix transcriptional regulator [Massilia oculi]|uniref:MarR family transcriptional regulator n=1 Tax=Massilia oculi TaxID=945844 RepID=A0A2S2DF98_9BURK|nr:metalloregulator ArsR/SmtB family transcription factor [Massilia oculi]AWL04030.1 MarR family transcriptional regulator [Massilia oculi]
MNTPERILLQLKMRGPQTAQALADGLGLTSMGVRRHLDQAQDKGLVESHDSSGKVGRPVRRWSLSEAGHARFPDRHAELTVDLIGQVQALFGPAAMERLIAAREQASEALYRSRLHEVAPDAPLARRVEALARVRDEEGYMAEAQPQEDGGVLLVEHHCPICAAAAACQDFCRSELAVFERVLGPEVKVVRIEHQLGGARRCAYAVTPRTAE